MQTTGAWPLAGLPWHLQASFALIKARFRATVAGSRHALHFDTGTQGDVLMVVLHGKKLVTLLPVSQLNATYPYPRKHLLARHAQVDLAHPDYARFPLARELTPMRMVLHAGDMLLVKRNMPHETEALTDVLSLTFRVQRKMTREDLCDS